MRTTLIIPAHNEQERLPETLATYGQTFSRRFGEGFEILVVANGCRDDTVGAARAAEEGCRVRVLDIPEPVGKGGAVLEGFRQTRGDRVVFADADGATAPDSLVEIHDRLDLHDVVIGSRRMEGSLIERAQTPVRRVFGNTFARISRLAFGLPYRDTQCGAKAFRTDAARRLARVVTETRWTFDLDLLISARKLGLKVHEHPVRWTDQEGSQLELASTSFEVLAALWYMKRNQRRPIIEPVVGFDAESDPARAA